MKKYLLFLLTLPLISCSTNSAEIKGDPIADAFELALSRKGFPKNAIEISRVSLKTANGLEFTHQIAIEDAGFQTQIFIKEAEVLDSSSTLHYLVKSNALQEYHEIRFSSAGFVHTVRNDRDSVIARFDSERLAKDLAESKRADSAISDGFTSCLWDGMIRSYQEDYGGCLRFITGYGGSYASCFEVAACWVSPIPQLSFAACNVAMTIGVSWACIMK